MCGRATRISGGCGVIISSCARAASSIGSLQDLKKFVQPGILDSFVERFFTNFPSERQDAAQALQNFVQYSVKPRISGTGDLKYKLHKYFIASCIIPFRTESNMNMDERFRWMNLPPLPKGATAHTLRTMPSMGACILLRLLPVHKPSRNTLGRREHSSNATTSFRDSLNFRCQRQLQSIKICQCWTTTTQKTWLLYATYVYLCC